MVFTRVRKAVLPAAGLGTRFLPITKAQPKEMLPLVDKPMIQYVVEEAVAAGLDEIIIVTGPGKRAIEEHFSSRLDPTLQERRNTMREKEREMLEELEHINEKASLAFVRQDKPLGLGHAVACAAKEVAGEPFAVMLADDIFVSRTPAIGQMISKARELGGSVMSIEKVAKELVSRFGIVKTEPFKGDFKILDIVEKPSVAEAPSQLATFGRYVFTTELMGFLLEREPGKNGEVQLVDGVKKLLEKQDVYACFVEGTRYDGGDKLAWLKSNVLLALQRPELKKEFGTFLERLVK